MMKLLATLMVVLTLISCDKAENKPSDLFSYVPERSSIIVSTKNLPVFLSQIDSSELLDQDKIESVFKLSALKEYAGILETSRSLISFYRKDSLSYNYLLIAEAKKDTLLTKNLGDFSVESISTNEHDYKKISLNDVVTYSAFINNTILASSSKKLLLEAVNHSKSNIPRTDSFKKAIAAASLDKTALFVNHSEIVYKTSNKKIPENRFPESIANWSVVDLNLDLLKMNFNGIAVSNSGSKNTLDLFRNIQHQKNEIQNIAPFSAKGFYSFTYTDFKKLYSNLKEHTKDSLVFNDNNLLNFTKEAGVIVLKNDENVLILNTMDAQLAKESLPSSEDLLTEYRGIPIHSISGNTYLKFLEPLIPSEEMEAYAFLDNFLVYAKTQEALESIIGNYQNNTTVSKQESFIDLQSNLAESSSLLVVSTPKMDLGNDMLSMPFQIQQEFASYLSNKHSFSAIQFVKSEGFSHIHGAVSKAGKVQNEEVEETITISLPEPISGEALLLSISNNPNAIVYQDLNNILYAVSNNGKTLWKKQLDTKIVGEIHQIALKGNGNPLLAFTTLSKLQVLNSNGKEAAGFPIEFKDDITQPLAIFDYDNNKNYRFVVTQKKEVFMYDSKGNAVKGFNFDKTSSEIIQPPKHIRIKNKDYIVVPEENGQLHILSRQGKERISVKGKMEFSESAWYENNNYFVSLSKDNKILKVDTNGKISTQEVNGTDGLKITAEEKVLVLLSENVLTINKNEIQLDYGLYTNPKLHLLGGKSYISVADTQAKKVYLFNDKGELLPDFPVYGVGVSGIISANRGNAKTALILGEGNEVIFYGF